MSICDFLSLRDYWYATVSAVIGCLIGIQWAKAQQKRQRAQKDKESRAALLVAIDRILNLAGQAIEKFENGGQPNFPLEHHRPALLCDRVSEFRDKYLRGEIEGFLYQCSHYNAKLTTVNAAYMTALVTKSSSPLLKDYSDMMARHLKEIIGWSKPVIEKLKKEDA